MDLVPFFTSEVICADVAIVHVNEVMASAVLLQVAVYFLCYSVGLSIFSWNNGGDEDVFHFGFPGLDAYLDYPTC